MQAKAGVMNTCPIKPFGVRFARPIRPSGLQTRSNSAARPGSNCLNYGGVFAASYMFSALTGWADTSAVTPVAERAALAAICADGEAPWAHLALGCTSLSARRFDDSLAEFQWALRLNPNFSLAQGYHGLALSYCGRWRKAPRPQAVRCG
ncbi:MAG TPA: hypothetical protein VGM32_15720 [Rhodopila sp.]|jgi:tetratricopeptide (TPR) repeat protein